MDLIYQIGSVLLYDNDLKRDYIILLPKNNIYQNGLTNYDISLSLNKIHNMPKPRNEESIKEFESTVKYLNGKFIKNDNFLTLDKIEGTHLPNYNAYDIYWNETKSGINITEHDILYTWNIGSSQYSSYMVQKEGRKRDIRSYSLDMLKI